jgi:hypothetical protein
MFLPPDDIDGDNGNDHQVPARRFLQLIRARINIGYSASSMRCTLVNTGEYVCARLGSQDSA